jgi:N-acetylneuraminic acid mutarotase
MLIFSFVVDCCLFVISSAAEAQGGIIGDDLVIISGFTMGYKQATAKVYALNLRDPLAPWRAMDDLPVQPGITHAAYAVVGLKLYMCGGYVG